MYIARNWKPQGTTQCILCATRIIYICISKGTGTSLLLPSFIILALEKYSCLHFTPLLHHFFTPHHFVSSYQLHPPTTLPLPFVLLPCQPAHLIFVSLSTFTLETWVSLTNIPTAGLSLPRSQSWVGETSHPTHLVVVVRCRTLPHRSFPLRKAQAKEYSFPKEVTFRFSPSLKPKRCSEWKVSCVPTKRRWTKLNISS